MFINLKAEFTGMANLTKYYITKITRNCVGDDVVPVIEYLLENPRKSEFVIGEKIGKQAGEVRSMLYRLQSANLVSYYRKKDIAVGWYISYWSVNGSEFRHRMSRFATDRRQELLERLQVEKKFESLFYICPRLCSRSNIFDAMTSSFKCTVCGSVLKHQDNSSTIVNLQSQFARAEACE